MGMKELDTKINAEDGEMTLKEAIAKIPGEDGWWKSHSQETFEEHAVDLVKLRTVMVVR
jgi:hypothetical protein